MTEKITQPDRIAAASAAVTAGRQLRGLFGPGLRIWLEPDNLGRFAEWWADRAFHKGVSKEHRTGFVLRARSTHDVATGLLASRYSRLGRADVPSSHIQLNKMLSFLIAAPMTRGDEKHAAQARSTALKSLNRLSHTDGVEAHVDELWSLRGENAPLYEALVLGDFVTVKSLIVNIADEETSARVVRVAAGQRIIWSAWDVHRATAASRDLPKRLVPWFMRPFIHTDTAASMINGMLCMSSAMLRLYRSQDTAKRHNRQKVVVPGPSGLVLSAVAPAARRIEATLPRALEANVVSAMSDIRARTQEWDDKLRAMKADPEWSEQQSRHEHYYGLTALGGLFMVSYRFAEDEAAALEAIADPSKWAALFSIDPRPFPRELDRKHVARALHMLAVYRELLGQGLRGYDLLKVWDAHPVRDHAAEVITHMATAKELSPALCRARSMFDLSHHHRSGSAR